jgi:hypothetical protein
VCVCVCVWLVDIRGSNPLQGRAGDLGFCPAHGGSGRCTVGAIDGQGGCGYPIYRNGKCRHHGGCICRDTTTHPTCPDCWPLRFRRPEDFDPNGCFIVCAFRADHVPPAMPVALARAIDTAINVDALPGWMGDTPAHMSANLSQVRVDARQGIAAVMQLLLDQTHGIGSVVKAAADGKNHALRCHRQDGCLGNSQHAPHHDGFLSAGRYLTGVIVTAASEHARWLLERSGCGRTTIVLPDSSSVYVLLFAASANAMATHAVSGLPPTPVDAPPRMYDGAAER